MWIEFHDNDGQVQLEQMLLEGLEDARYHCEQMIIKINTMMDSNAVKDIE